MENVKIINEDLFSIGKYEFIKFTCDDGNVIGVLKDSLGDMRFGDSNDFSKSDILKNLTEKFLPEIESIVGVDNVLEFETDLISLDGLRTYDACNAKCSLMTFDMARSYVDILDRYKLDQYWWLSTPWSTPEHGYSSTVCIVSPSGYFGSYGYGFNCDGVRPFCILKSDIFVS